MNAHTPGPWHATSSGEGLPLTRIGYLMRSVGGGYGSHCIALMSVSQRDDEQVSANARLIAAAPDLLDEVRKTADTFAEFAKTFRLFGYPTAAEACLVAERSNRAAIAKATGERSHA